MTSSYLIPNSSTSLVFYNGTLVPLNSTSSNMSTRRKLSYKIGRLVGKAKKFFSKSETKVTAIATYWAVETVLFGILIVSAPTTFVAGVALFLYLYGSYALFSAANSMIG